MRNPKNQREIDEKLKRANILNVPSYAFYVDEYYSTSIPHEDWNRLAARSIEEIEYFERCYKITGTDKQRNKAVCAIADAIYSAETVSSMIMSVDSNGGMGASSISIGSISTSYKAPDVNSLKMDLSEEGQRKLYYNILKKYLTVCRGFY